MTYSFRGTPDEMVKGITDDLRRAAAGGAGSDAYFRRALVSVVGLHVRQAAEEPSRPGLNEQRRDQLVQALSSVEDSVSSYVAFATVLAEGANEDEWYELCFRRSAIQFLVDDFAGTKVAPLIDANEVAEFDVELHRVGLDQGPVPEEFVPAGLPDSHWWWKYPDSPAQT